MSETKAEYLTTEFLAAASKAKHIAHNLYCETCGETTDHALHISGSFEVYSCPQCGNSQIFKVS